jgi:hypothetical protein
MPSATKETKSVFALTPSRLARSSNAACKLLGRRDLNTWPGNRQAKGDPRLDPRLECITCVLNGRLGGITIAYTTGQIRE